MTTKLEAINIMLSCIGQAPLNTLEGTKSYFTVSAENTLDAEVKRIQLEGWYFNTEKLYRLQPDKNNIIKVPDDLIEIRCSNFRYVVRKKKVYDLWHHTFEIKNPITVEAVFRLNFEDMPEVAQTYAYMSAAYKFVKREFGADKTCVYTQEDLAEAKQIMLQHELEIANYTMIPDYYNGNIKGEL